MRFDVDKTVAYWREGAEYDLVTAESLLKAGRYPYALFFGHLAIEKLPKALVVKETKQHASFTHSLPLLASKLMVEFPDEIKKDFARFMEFYIESRYPEQQRDFYEKCTCQFTEENLARIKETYQWLRQKF